MGSQVSKYNRKIKDKYDHKTLLFYNFFFFFFAFTFLSLTVNEVKAQTTPPSFSQSPYFLL